VISKPQKIIFQRHFWAASLSCFEPPQPQFEDGWNELHTEKDGIKKWRPHVPATGLGEQHWRGKEDQDSYSETPESFKSPTEGDRQRKSSTEEVFDKASQNNWLFSSNPILVTDSSIGERLIS
jgi:hypothetical protein